MPMWVVMAGSGNINGFVRPPRQRDREIQTKIVAPPGPAVPSGERPGKRRWLNTLPREVAGQPDE